MMTFNWSRASSTLKDFGGKPVILYVPKTGLPFFDVLRLYGAIDLYIGLREDVAIHDAGNEWEVRGRRRTHLLEGRDVSTFKQVWNKKKPDAGEFCDFLRSHIFKRHLSSDSYFIEGKKSYDSILQTGIRGTAAYSYETLQTGQTSKPECKADIPLARPSQFEG